MSQFFNKVACFTDIHFGNKNNSRQHNDDCERFIYWFIEQAKEAGCETCIFLGDPINKENARRNLRMRRKCLNQCF